MVKGILVCARKAEFLYYGQSVWPWAAHLCLVCLTFYICQMGLNDNYFIYFMGTSNAQALRNSVNYYTTKGNGPFVLAKYTGAVPHSFGSLDHGIHALGTLGRKKQTHLPTSPLSSFQQGSPLGKFRWFCLFLNAVLRWLLFLVPQWDAKMWLKWTWDIYVQVGSA